MTISLVCKAYIWRLCVDMCLVYNYCRPMRRNIHETRTYICVYVVRWKLYSALGCRVPQAKQCISETKGRNSLCCTTVYVRLWVYGYTYFHSTFNTYWSVAFTLSWCRELWSATIYLFSWLVSNIIRSLRYLLINWLFMYDHPPLLCVCVHVCMYLCVYVCICVRIRFGSLISRYCYCIVISWIYSSWGLSNFMPNRQRGR